MSNLPLEKQFELALAYVQNSMGKEQYGDSRPPPSNEDKLEFYAFFKQATVGPCDQPQPWAINLVARAKHDSWSALGDMKKDEAMKKYVEKLKTLAPEFLDFEGLKKFM